LIVVRGGGLVVAGVRFLGPGGLLRVVIFLLFGVSGGSGFGVILLLFSVGVSGVLFLCGFGVIFLLLIFLSLYSDRCGSGGSSGSLILLLVVGFVIGRRVGARRVVAAVVRVGAGRIVARRGR